MITNILLEQKLKKINKSKRRDYLLDCITKNSNKISPKIENEPIVLVRCGKNMIINPSTGRCVLINGKIGKKLTSIPYIIVDGKKPIKNDPPLEPPLEPDKYYPPIELDTDSDNYVSIKEYLSAVESKGPLENPGRGFINYANSGFSIYFLLKLLQKQKNAPINHVACIPNYLLCIDTITGQVINSEIDKDGNLFCRTDPLSLRHKHAQVELLNASMRRMTDNELPMKLLIPPNFKSVINKCSDDNKTIVTCKLSLRTTSSGHSNALVINLVQKTIERFDPHGYDYYILDDNENKKKTYGPFNQEKIDNYLTKQFNTILPGYKYLGPDVTCPYLGPQIKTDAFKGLCLTWSTMYMILRILNYKLSPDIITKKMITGTKEQLLSKILRFQKFMIDTVKS